MKKLVETHTWYVCEVCGDYHDTEVEARECEAQAARKVKMGGKDDWEIGEFVALYVHDTGWKLARITGTQQKGHILDPEFTFMDGTRRPLHGWMDEEMIRTDIEKELLKWADQVRAIPPKKKETKPPKLPR